MKVLVTGASGFVGKYVITELLKIGEKVLATSRNKEKMANQPWIGEISYFPFTIGNEFSLEERAFFGQADRCIHLAWDGLPDFNDTKHGSEYPEKHLDFLSQLIELGVPKITCIGTCLEYGLQEGEQTETNEPNPTTSYGIGKNKLRKDLEALQKRNNFAFDWLRLYYMYGNDQHPKSIIPQLEKALKDGETQFNMSKGEQMRDYLPVEKVAEIIVNLSLKESGCEVVNCCSGYPVKMIDFIHNYLEKQNKTIELNRGYYPYPDYEPFQFWGSRKKLDQILNEKSANRKI